MSGSLASSYTEGPTGPGYGTVRVFTVNKVKCVLAVWVLWARVLLEDILRGEMRMDGRQYTQSVGKNGCTAVARTVMQQGGCEE